MRSLSRSVALFSLVACLIFRFFSAELTQAQTIWVEKNPDIITATVPDFMAPTAPTLIAPSDGSSHLVLPQFVWQGSTDNIAVTGYDFTVDGVDVFANLPVNSGSGPGYTLTESGGTHTLTITNPALISMGTHTWYVTARDGVGNQTDSVTWTFTVDDSADPFVVEQIDNGGNLGISAQDQSTWRAEDDPVLLDNQNPDISGTGDPGSTFQIQVCRTTTCAFDHEKVGSLLTGTVGLDGTWKVGLPTLPRDVVLFIDIVIADSNGAYSYIYNLPIKLAKETIVLPPGWTITLIPGETIVPEIIYWWMGTLIPFIEEITDPIEEIVDPPKEPKPTPAVTPATTPGGPVVLEEEERPTTSLSEAEREGERRVLSPVVWAHFLALVALILLPTIKTLLNSLANAPALSLRLFGQILFVVGFWPSGRPKIGLVLKKETFEPIPGVVVEFVDTKTGELLVKTVTDEMGRFSKPDDVDVTRLRVRLGKEYLAAPPRATDVDLLDWYDNDELQLDKILPRGGAAIPIPNFHRNPLTTKILRRPKYPFLSIALSTIITIITPTLGNLFFSTFAILIWAVFFIKHNRRKVTAAVYYKSLMHINDAVIRVANNDRPGLYLTANNPDEFVALDVRKGVTRLEAFTTRWEYAHPEEFDLRRNAPNVHFDLIVEETK